jgi:hypothetical protein
MAKGGIVTRRQESLVKYRVLWQREERGYVLVLGACKISGSRGEVEKATWPLCPRSREGHETLMSEK